MKTIDNIRELLDEMPILSQIAKDLPFPYKPIINQKIKEFNSYLEEIHSQELDINNSNLKNSNVIASETEETEKIETVKENFFGEIIENKTYNSTLEDENYLDELAKKYAKK